MRRTVSTTCLLLAWLCANGAVWNVVQAVAWAKMFHEYSQVMPVTDAISLTFDGSAPCNLCSIAQEAQDTARSTLPGDAALGGGADRILFVADCTPIAVMAPIATAWPIPTSAAAPSRTSQVPVPPPRA